MKIGFFTDSYLPSPDGVATSVESCAKELQKLGHEVYIIAPNQPHKKERKHIYRLVSVRILKSPDIWWTLEIPQPALFKIANLEFDIIHGHSGGSISLLGWQLARLHNIPFIETYHTLWKYYRHYVPHSELIKLWMLKKFIGFIGNGCDALITPSEKGKQDLLSDGVKKPVYVVPNGLYLDRYANQKKGFLFQKYAIPNEKKIIITVGRLHKEKAIDFLIKSFAVAHEQNPNTVFVIVGEGQKKEHLQKLAKDLRVADHVYFIGTVAFDDMPHVYADADAFIFASHTETQGMVIYEALASGVPVIAVTDDAFETVIVNDKNGYLVKKDAKLFAKKVNLLLQNHDLHKKLRQNAKESAEQYSVEVTTRILEQVYQEVLFENETNQNQQKTKLTKLDNKMLSLMGIKKHISKEYETLKELLERVNK